MKQCNYKHRHMLHTKVRYKNFQRPVRSALFKGWVIPPPSSLLTTTAQNNHTGHYSYWIVSSKKEDGSHWCTYLSISSGLCARWARLAYQPQQCMCGVIVTIAQCNSAVFKEARGHCTRSRSVCTPRGLERVLKSRKQEVT